MHMSMSDSSMLMENSKAKGNYLNPTVSMRATSKTVKSMAKVPINSATV